MAKRFSENRMQPFKNLKGKREQKKMKDSAARTKTDDLFGEDVVIKPRIVKNTEIAEKKYKLESQKQLEKDMRELSRNPPQKAQEAQEKTRQQISDPWASAPGSQAQKRASLMGHLLSAPPKSCESYNPDGVLHQKALNEVANKILDQQIKQCKTEASIPRAPTLVEQQMESEAAFLRLLGKEQEEQLPASIQGDILQYQQERAEAEETLKRLQSLKEQIQTDEGDEITFDNFKRIRKQLYDEIDAAIPDIKIDPKLPVRQQIEQYAAFYTPEKIGEIIKMKQIARLRASQANKSLQAVGECVQRDFPILEKAELGASMKNLRQKGQLFQDQLNGFARKNIIPGYIRQDTMPRQTRYKVGYRWWNE